MSLVDSIVAVTTATPVSGFAAWMPMVQSLGGVLVGGAVTYLVGARTDRRKDAQETRRLALPVAEELLALLEVDEEPERRATKFGRAYLLESLRYADLSSDFVPITREAAQQIGRFPEPIAQAIAHFLVVTTNFRRNADILGRMQAAGALTDDKLRIRLQALKKIFSKWKSAARWVLYEVRAHYKLR